MPAFKWGIIGSSGWADHTFGPAVANAKGNQLVAVLGSKTKGAIGYAAKHQLESAYTNLQEFLQHPGLDAVWVASPPDLHRAQTVAALRAGLHVLCEKPMAVAPEDCKAMVRAATAASRELRIGFNNRAHPTLQKLAKLAASGRLGEPLEANVQVYYQYPSPPAAWRQTRKRSGGWAIGDIGTHLLDVLCWMMNAAPQAANGHLTNRCWQFKTDDHAAVSVRFKNGALGNITACTGATGGAPRVAYYGTRGYFVLSGGLFGAPGSVELGFKGKDPTTEKFDAVDTYRAEVEQFAATARGRASTLASGGEGAMNIAIVSAARGW